MRVCSTPNELDIKFGSVPGPNFHVPPIFDLSRHFLGQCVRNAVDLSGFIGPFSFRNEGSGCCVDYSGSAF